MDDAKWCPRKFFGLRYFRKTCDKIWSKYAPLSICGNRTTNGKTGLFKMEIHQLLLQ